LCDELDRQLTTGLHVWAADINHGNRPRLLTEVVLDEALRSPLSVTREVEKSLDIGKGHSVYPYCEPSGPLHCHGPSVQVIVHSPQQGQGHKADEAVDCEECGTGVAHLLNRLNVTGVTGRTVYYVLIYNL
jgi:hypothetical protein